MKIIKRDGRVATFKTEKIEDAILKAFVSLDGEITPYAEQKAENIAKYILEYTKEYKRKQYADWVDGGRVGPQKLYLGVEEVQDLVEKGLMSTKRKDVAKAYSMFREERNRRRRFNSKLMAEIRKFLFEGDKENQNANVDGRSFGGRKGEATNVLLKQVALDDIVTYIVRKNHIENRDYLHDLDSYALGMHNCLSVPFDHLLEHGFVTRQTDVRPANSIATAFQLVAVIFQLQSLQQFGGVSATHLDWTMVPYVRKSFAKHYMDGMRWIEATNSEDHMHYKNKLWVTEFFNGCSIEDEKYERNNAYKYAMEMTIKECQQAVEGMYHNLNTLQSRSGNQLPFTSINYGTCTLPEGRMITKALLEGCITGVGKFHKTSIFPCGIFQCMKGVNRKPGDPNYDLFLLALNSTAQRIYPNYANVDWSGNEGYDINDPKTYFSTMGCRTANGWDANGLGQTKDGRGNICPATIIMPTLAMEVKLENENASEEELVNKFIEYLDKHIHYTKDALIDRYLYICSQPMESAKFMYENNVMTGYVPEEGIRSALKHGTLAIGQIGLAETLQILIGCDHTEEKGMIVAKRIEQLFKDRCAEFKKELHRDEDGYEYYLNFGVYYTPAENLCYTAMMKFQKRFGKIKNVSDRDFFTNSIHVPVWKEMTPFEKIDIEAQLTGYSSAGCITYIELDSSVKNNIEALETIVNYAMDKDIPYFAINVPNDQCNDCGYMDDLSECCTQCGSDNIKRLRRVTGYLTEDISRLNPGKKAETKMRVKHFDFSKKIWYNK